MQDSPEINQKVPVWVAQIEDSLLQGLVGFLQSINPSIQAKLLAFLCEPWVHFFSHGTLHRYELIKRERSIAASFNTVNSPPPGDTHAFLELSRTVDYKCMIDSSLLGETVSFRCRNTIETIRHSDRPSRATITCYKTGLPRKFRYLLSWLSLWKIKILNKSGQLLHHPPDTHLREKLQEHLSGCLDTPDSSLTTWISGACAALFPVSILESLGSSWLKKTGLYRQTALFSANAWDIIDEWKIYASVQKSMYQTKWIGSPHALNHGSLEIFWQREFELKYLDKYLTWGWTPIAEHNADVTDFYPPHFPQEMNRPPRSIDWEKGILISSAGRSRHLLEYPYYPENFLIYLETQVKLAQQLQSHTQLDVTIRNRPKDLGWDLENMIRELKNLKITIEFQKGTFRDRLKRCALHVCDNFSTTIAESLLQNHPTLILITHDYFLMHAQARNAWQDLNRVGILHHSVEGLITQIERIKQEPLTWWNHADTQSAIKYFLHDQARNGGDIWKWMQALLKVART